MRLGALVFLPLSILEALLIAVLLASSLFAQSPVQQAAHTISPEDIRRRIGIIADDSMRGRDTPSPELDEVAAYLAGEYRRLGMKPAGGNGRYLQRYSLDRVQVVAESSTASLHGAEDDISFKYGTDFAFSNNVFEHGDYAGTLVLLDGPLNGTISGDTAALAGKMLIVFYNPRNRGERERLLRWKPAGIVLASAVPDSDWARIVRRSKETQLRDPSRKAGSPIVLSMRADSLLPILTLLNPNMGIEPAPGTVQVTSLGAQFRVQARVRAVQHNSAPNVVAILEGSDPTLKNEYVAFSAHMDHVGVAGPRGSGGCRARGADSICNGADDDGSGTVAVIEIAEAFARLQPRPKRSLLFLNVSGEEKGLWGSEYFADHPTVPMSSVVADLNIDMIGRNWKDTIVAIGKEHSDLGATLNRVAAAHPELNMRPIDDIWPQENFYFRSDHYNFARKGVPVLFFFSGTHRDYHEPGDSPEKIDAEKESRVARLIFYLGLELANAPGRPKWNPDSYKRIVSGN